MSLREAASGPGIVPATGIGTGPARAGQLNKPAAGRIVHSEENKRMKNWIAAMLLSLPPLSLLLSC